MKRKHFWTAISVFFALSGTAFGQDALELSSPWVFGVDPVIWGADVGVGYRGLRLAPGVDTTFWVYGGGSFERLNYERLPDGSLITGEAPDSVRVSKDIPYDRWSLRWRLGVAQGLLWNPRTDADLLEAFLYYRGRYDWNVEDRPSQLVFLSDLPDKRRILQNAVLAGVSYDDLLLERRHATWSGMSAEASLEWGPAFFFNTEAGKSDYIRFNLSARAFLPLYDAAPESARNVLSVYAGDFISVDYAFGPEVPLNVRQSFGGLNPRIGLGGAVRGVDEGSLDTNLKLVNNLDVRVNLPSLGPTNMDLVPGFVAYLDAGFYNQVGESGVDPERGFVSSMGAGFYLDVMNVSSLTVYTSYRLTGVNADGSKLTPLEFHYNLRF